MLFTDLVICAFIIEIFFVLVLTNLSLFQMVHFQSFYNETVMNDRIASLVLTILFLKSLITNIREVTDIRMSLPRFNFSGRKLDRFCP